MTDLPENLTAQELVAFLDVTSSRIVALQDRQYIPHDGGPDGGQLAFHQSVAPIRAIFSANRFGKTRAALQEGNWRCTGRHPYVETRKPPVYGRSVAEGFDYGVNQVLLPTLRDKVVDPNDLKGGSWEKAYSKREHTLYYENGSRWQFMSFRLADMGRGTQIFGGVDLDFVHHDETSPNDIWEENLARLVRYNGVAMMTLTPVLGITWEHDLIYTPWTRGATDIACFRGTMWDNPHLVKASIDRYASQLTDPTTRAIRTEGLWQSIGGRVYPTYNSNLHFVEVDPSRIRNAMKFVFVDPAQSKPNAVLWCGTDRMGEFAYQELRANGTPRDMVNMIREKSAGQYISDWYIDSKWEWTDQNSGTSLKRQYIEAGLPVKDAPGDKWGRIAMMQDALAVDPNVDRPRFVVMKSCPRLDWEFKYKQYHPQKRGKSDRPSTVDRDDDLLTCAEYFEALRPGAFLAAGMGGRTGPVYPQNVVARFGNKHRGLRVRL